ncbi:MAG: amidase domain-containing protein [Eubacteriaceae bacterium]
MKKYSIFLLIIFIIIGVWFLTAAHINVNAKSVSCVNPTEYSRTKAIEYAESCFNKRNNQYYGYGQDCANFVSQCLYSGGMPINGNWYSYKMDDCFFYCGDVTITWSRAPEQYAYYKKSEFICKNISIKSISDIKDAIKEGVQAGDLIYFDNDIDGTPDHAAMISKVDSGMIYYTAHTFARYNQPLLNYFKTGNKGQIYIVMLKDNYQN